MKIDKTLKKAVAGSALALLAVSGSALADDESTTTYKFGGYAKFDAMFSDYSDGTPATEDILRTFYFPANIPVGTGSSSDDITADFQARETRINFRADTKTAGGDSITAFIEMDFFVNGGAGNQVVSNSYNPRLRHAFVKYNNWTFGQTWSTFQDVAALPEALDFVGPAESTTFIRQAMVRYTSGNLEIAAENPQTFVASVDATNRGESTIPDLVARYTFKIGDNGSYIKLAGLYRSLKLQDIGGSQPDETAYGISASTKFMFGNGADLRAMVTFGDGVGRYVGLSFVRDGYLDGANIRTAEALAYYVALRMPFGNGWRSNIMYGNTSIDYDNDLDADGLNDSGSSFHLNFIKNVLPKLDLGVELMWAEREVIDVIDDPANPGTDIATLVDGDFTRVMFSAKYAF